MLRAFVRYTSTTGTIVPMSLTVRETYPTSGGIWKEVAETQCCSTFTPGNVANTQHKAWIQYGANGTVVPGSLIIRPNKPTGGNWVEIAYDLCCSVG